MAEIKKNKNLAIIIYSCLKNCDMWEYFSASMQKYWNDCAYTTVLLTDKYETSEKWSFDKIVCFSADWAHMLTYAMGQLETKYVSLFMDDYLFTASVRNEDIEKAIDIAEESDALCVRLIGKTNIGGMKQYKNYLNIYECIPKTPYSITLQPCVWNRQYLSDYLMDRNWSAWEFEREGSMDYHDIRHPILTRIDYTIPYIEGVRKGKWLPAGVRWCGENGLPVNKSKRKVFGGYDRFAIWVQGRLLHMFPNAIIRIQNHFSSKKNRSF